MTHQQDRLVSPGVWMLLGGGKGNRIQEEKKILLRTMLSLENTMAAAQNLRVDLSFQGSRVEHQHIYSVGLGA